MKLFCVGANIITSQGWGKEFSKLMSSDVSFLFKQLGG